MVNLFMVNVGMVHVCMVDNERVHSERVNGERVSSVGGVGEGGGTTHGVDARQLLGQLQHDGDEDGLAVQRRAEQLGDGHLLLPHHLPVLALHLLHVGAHVRGPPELLQHCGGNGGTRVSAWVGLSGCLYVSVCMACVCVCECGHACVCACVCAYRSWPCSPRSC